MTPPVLGRTSSPSLFYLFAAPLKARAQEDGFELVPVPKKERLTSMAQHDAQPYGHDKKINIYTG